MTKPPIKKLDQSDWEKTTVRLPPELHKELVRTADRKGHSMNAEILSRLENDKLDQALAELADVKAMLRKLLDQM